MTTTPFELRQNMLHFAKDSLVGEYYAKLERIREMTKEDSEERQAMVSQLKYPDTSDIISLASQFKEFVDNK